MERVLDDAFAFRGSMGTETSSPDGWRAYRDAIRRGSPDFHKEVIDLVAGGDAAAARLRYTGHHRGPLPAYRGRAVRSSTPAPRSSPALHD